MHIKLDARPYARTPLDIHVSEDATIHDLRALIEKEIPKIDASSAKLIGSGGKLIRLGSGAGSMPLHLLFGETANEKEMAFKLMASTKADISAIQNAKEVPGIASFEHEEERERRRQLPSERNVATSSESLFAEFRPWQPKNLSLVPPLSEALKLLQTIATDAGILGVMKKHRWKVGVLSELPPEGYVGVSPVCVLGYNRNAGQEISLRLRTDDLRGFRRYDRIRETLIHELAHNVFSEHDNNFKELNSRLKREVESLDWRGASGARTVSEEKTAPFAPSLNVDTRKSVESGRYKLPGKLPSVSPREAAVAAAEQRVRAAKLSSHPVQIEERTPSPSIPESPPQKGDIVEYKQRDGSWVAAKVVAIDFSVVPPSYGIELTTDNGMTYRETELSRLRKTFEEGKESLVEGLGHRDAATEAKEAEVNENLE